MVQYKHQKTIIKNHMFSRVLAVATVMLVLPFFVFAQETMPPVEVTAEKLIVQLIADVNLQDCEYTQSTSADQVVHISCNVTNKLGSQGDIHYGVQLLKREAGTQEVMDTKVYDQVLSLGVNQTIRQQIEYAPPSYLEGEYELWGLLRTSDGLPLSTNFLGKVTLKTTTADSYLEIKSNTCSLRVQGDTGTTTYNIRQGVDIDPDETIEGTCEVEAHNTGDVTVTPSFITYRRSVFGEIVSDTKDIQQLVTFKNNETKVILFVIPKALIPQSYDTVLSLVSSDGTVVSNDVAIHYVLRGAGVTIQNVLLDKDYYVAGDTAQVSVFWTGSEGGLRKSLADDKAKSLVISINDGNNNLCAKETTFAVSANKMERSALTAYPLLIIRLCINPQVTIKIVDDTSAILAKKTIALTSGSVPKSVTQNPWKQRSLLFSLVALLVVFVSISIVFIRNRNKTI